MTDRGYVEDRDYGDGYDRLQLCTDAHREAVRQRFDAAGEDVRVEFTNPRVGFFAQMNFCLNLAYYAEATSRRVSVILSSSNYRDPDHGPNWLEYFFDQRRPARRDAGVARIRIMDCCELPFNTDTFDLPSAHDLFARHFAIKSDIVAAVDRHANMLEIGSHTLGVHFRGTDKYREADAIAPRTAIEKIRAVLASTSAITNLFVASDDAAFVRSMHEQVSTVPVVSLDDSVRSDGVDPIHLSGLRPGNRAMARDALLNSLMLARCGQLVRTTSFLSAWSSIFNPGLDVALLNQPRPECLWFPETRILETARML